MKILAKPRGLGVGATGGRPKGSRGMPRKTEVMKGHDWIETKDKCIGRPFVNGCPRPRQARQSLAACIPRLEPGNEGKNRTQRTMKMSPKSRTHVVVVPR